MIITKRSAVAVLGVFALGALALGCSGSGTAAGTPAAKTAAPVATAADSAALSDSLGRSTPIGTVQGFLAAAHKGDDERAAQYLQTNLRGAEAASLAHRLFVVLDRRMPARLNQISDNPDGSISDSLPLNQDVVGTIAAARGKVDILVNRVDRGKSGSVWLFSAETLDAVPDLYEEVTGGALVERVFPQFFVRTRVAGVPLFAWAVLIVGVPLVYLLTGPPVKLVLRLTRRRRRHGPPTESADVEPAEKPLRMLLVALLVTWLNSSIGFSLRGRQFWASTATVISIAAVVWLLVVVNGRAERYFRSRFAGRDQAGMTSILRLMRRTVDILIVAVGVLVGLSYFGVDPTAAVAGLGVGGIAVALAAQKTLENVIAGSSLVFDQAVRVGDYLKVAGYEGTVEDVGLRSTRIRTLDRTVVSVPNGQIATMSLEALSTRDKFWFHPLLRLRCETTVDQIRRVAEGMRALLAEAPAVERESVRVRFLGFGPASLDIEAFAYVFARDWSHFLAIQEGLLLRAMEIVQEAGSQIAIPSQVMYLEGRSEAQGRAAAVLNERPGSPSSPPVEGV